MTEFYRGDTRVATITLTDTVDPDNPVPLDLTGKHVRSTCREKVTSRPEDADKYIVYQHFIEIDGSGSVTASEGMALVGPASDGVIRETWSSTETAGFKLSEKKQFPFDLEVRAIGTPDVVSTPLKGTHTVVGDVTLPE